MGAQKNVPKKQKIKLLGLTCLFVKISLMKLRKISVLTTPTTANKSKYSRVDQVKFFKGCLPQILFGSLLNTLSQIWKDNFQF